MSGRLEVITGPMFSGKTEELIRRIRREQIAGKHTAIFKPLIDHRYGEDTIGSHNGTKLTAFPVANVAFAGEDYDVVGVDEGQFFEKGLIIDVRWLVNGLGKKVIVNGLDMTYRTEPFGVMPHLMAIADSVTKLSAVCNKCGGEALFTQRLVDGQPAPFSGDTIVVGGLDSYEARCRQCFEVG